MWLDDEAVTLVEAFTPGYRVVVAVFTITQLTGPATSTFWGMGWKVDCITLAHIPWSPFAVGNVLLGSHVPG